MSSPDGYPTRHRRTFESSTLANPLRKPLWIARNPKRGIYIFLGFTRLKPVTEKHVAPAIVMAREVFSVTITCVVCEAVSELRGRVRHFPERSQRSRDYGPSEFHSAKLIEGGEVFHCCGRIECLLVT